MAEGEKIIPINIENEMRTAYIDYSMSVIVSRALPDVRDGLKPVHRRVLFGMQDLGVLSNRPTRRAHVSWVKCSVSTTRTVTAAYMMPWCVWPRNGAYGTPWWMARVTSEASMAIALLPCVTPRRRFKKIAEEVLADLDKETVDMRPNFDDTLEEPSVMPTKIPNLLVNGAAGIAVGMATNMPPHNLSEVCDGIAAYIENKDIDVDGLMQHIKGPDFPTGGVIMVWMASAKPTRQAGSKWSCAPLATSKKMIAPAARRSFARRSRSRPTRPCNW
jgi:DNA gyrase subunit A